MGEEGNTEMEMKRKREKWDGNSAMFYAGDTGLYFWTIRDKKKQKWEIHFAPEGVLADGAPWDDKVRFTSRFAAGLLYLLENTKPENFDFPGMKPPTILIGETNKVMAKFLVKTAMAKITYEDVIRGKEGILVDLGQVRSNLKLIEKLRHWASRNDIQLNQPLVMEQP